MLLSKQDRDRDSAFWYPDPHDTKTVWVLNIGKIRVRDQGQGKGFVWVKRGIVTILAASSR